MRLIDADALEARMYHEAFETDSNLQKWDSGCWIRYKMFENAMAEAPTIDPVKHGEWIEELVKEYNRRLMEGGLKLAWIEKAVDSARPVCRQSAKRLSGLIRDINPVEIESQIEADNLRQWCEIIQREMRMAMEEDEAKNEQIH